MTVLWAKPRVVMVGRSRNSPPDQVPFDTVVGQSQEFCFRHPSDRRHEIGLVGTIDLGPDSTTTIV